MPDAHALAEARSKVGMNLVHLNENDFTISFEREGVMLDLGAIGKGCAVDRAAEILRENGIVSALIHGGTSTIYAIGHPPTGPWKIAVDLPTESLPPESSRARSPIANPVAVVQLQDEALSVSAPHGKFFRAAGRVFGHVLDPRTGEPAQSAILAAVVLPSATDSDALSTALLTLGPDGHDILAQRHSNIRTLTLALEEDGHVAVHHRGLHL